MAERLGYLYTSGFHARGLRPLPYVGLLASSKPASFVGPHFVVVVRVKSSAREVFESSTDDDVTGKEFTVRSFDPQKYRREKGLLTVFQCTKCKIGPVLSHGNMKMTF